MVGSIYLAKVFFTDGAKYKLRPILIIKENSFGDFIYIPFTTKRNNKNSLEFDNDSLISGSFQKKSYLIVDKTCTIQQMLLEKKIGTVNDTMMEKVLNEYCFFLRN